MLPGVSSTYNSALVLLLAASSWTSPCAAAPWTGLAPRFELILDYSPAPSPEDGPPESAGALRDPAYLPAQIGGIVGAYAFSLVLVALLLLALSKTRRSHLRNRDRPPEEDDLYFDFNPFPEPWLLEQEEEYQRQLEDFQKLSLQIPPSSHVRNFSLPSASPLSPTRTVPFSPTKSQRSVFTAPSPTSTILAPGIDLSVDQTVVARDRAMAQQQLEEMYKHVMEQEQAKEEGREYQGPMLTSPSANTVNASPAKASKKERIKPSSLNLARDEKSQSRGSSIFSFLKSPRKNKMGAPGMSISSPIMTPQSATFPRHDGQEMNPMSPRYYAPPAAAPISTSDLPFRRAAASAAGSSYLPTPNISPVSTQSIDSRIDAAIGQAPSRASRREQREQRGHPAFPSHSRDPSTATSGAGGPDHEPVSATSERSTTGLVGLPTSPRPGVNRFPSVDSLPASPRPYQQSFHLPPPTPGFAPPTPGFAPPTPGLANPNYTNNSSTASFPRPSIGAASTTSSAVRQGGALPLRAYEPSLSSPTAASYATKQTVFTRGPMSPGMPTGMRTPWTGAPVPYTPYQPFSPVVPITPSVVTKADRKRMKRMEPRTPTVEMVRDSGDVW